MKKLTKILCLLMALCMMLCFTACDEDDDDKGSKSIAGTYQFYEMTQDGETITKADLEEQREAAGMADEFDRDEFCYRELNKDGTGTLILMGEEIGLSEADADEILKFIAITGTNEEVLAALESYRGRNEIFDLGLSELNTVVKYLAAFGVPAENFAVDLTIARGLDYYTGTVYETTLLDHPEIGSVCSGGRYDNLAEYYTDKQLPGVGISIGLTRLFYVLGEQGMLNPELPTAPADVLILPMTDDLSAAISFATALRENGIRAQIHGEQKKFKQKISYADKLGIPYVVFLGEDEINAGVVACKDMKTGEQTKLEPAATIYRIKSGLAELEKGAVILEK